MKSNGVEKALFFCLFQIVAEYTIASERLSLFFFFFSFFLSLFAAGFFTLRPGFGKSISLPVSLLDPRGRERGRYIWGFAGVLQLIIQPHLLLVN